MSYRIAEWLMVFMAPMKIRKIPNLSRDSSKSCHIFPVTEQQKFS